MNDATPTLDSDDRARVKRRAQLRASVMRQTLRWHWISAAICLIGLLLFAVTGFTLNHAADIEAKPREVARTAALPADLLAQANAAREAGGALPPSLAAWARKALGAPAPSSADNVEWSEEEVFVDLPGPGSDGALTIDLTSGEARFERTTRGVVAYLNDLHKGRNTGPVWKVFLDVFVVGCIVFCATGLILLQLHAKARRSTWPLVASGLLIPLVLALFFVHGR